MSRVREALKLMEVQHQPVAVAATPRVRLELIQPPRLEPQAVEPVEDGPEIPGAAKSKPSAFSRYVRQIRRWLGIRRPGDPVPICTGLTRQGRPCRAPAMANGYCRMHGGSRNLLVKPV